MEITNEIKAKVFAQYLGCDLKTQTGKVQLVGIHVDNFKRVFDAVVLNGNVTHKSEIEGVKLILKPLSDITDEDAVEVAKMLWGNKMPNLIETIKHQLFTYSVSDVPARCYQLLQSKGYDMPQYLLGGKTLHEAGLAIYEN